MIPLKDDIPTRSFPLVTLALIAGSVLVYIYEFTLWPPGIPEGPAEASAQRAYQAFILEFGLIPCRVSGTCPAVLATHLSGAPPPWLTVFSSMFLHGGLFHLGGNMLYLWIFGNNIEDIMGKGRFLVFYLLCGTVAAGAQYLGGPSSPVPMIGASGAVSGTLGAYLLMYPHARVWTLFVFGFLVRLVPVPAVVVLGFWIVLQVLNATAMLGRTEGGGVAFLAHVGGFVAGMALVHVFRRDPRVGYRRH